MQLKNLEPEMLPIDKLPHLRFQIESVERADKIIAKLNARKQLLKKLLDVEVDPTHLHSLYEQNERELLLIKTDTELAKTHTDKIQKNNYIKDLRNDFVAILKEMDSNWADLIDEANNLKESNEKIKNHLDKLDMVLFNENWEYAIDFYVNLKYMIHPPQEETPTMARV